MTKHTAMMKIEGMKPHSWVDSVSGTKAEIGKMIKKYCDARGWTAGKVGLVRKVKDSKGKQIGIITFFEENF